MTKNRTEPALLSAYRYPIAHLWLCAARRWCSCTRQLFTLI